MTKTFCTCYRLFLVYLTLYLAYTPRTTPIRSNILVDYLSVIHIYGFPTQQGPIASFQCVLVLKHTN